MNCRYDPTHGYLTPLHWPACRAVDCDGCLPCEHDEDGNRIRHCTNWLVPERDERPGKPCLSHLRADENLTCQRCIERFKANLRRIGQLAELLPFLALEKGRVDSEAMNLLAVAANPSKVRDRRVSLLRMIAELPDEVRERAREALPDEDTWHPYSVLGRWDMMLREDYDEPTTLRVTIPRAIAYLSAKTATVAQAPDQDFGLLFSEVRVVLGHLEAVLSIVRRPELGAPCPECPTPAKSLRKRYSHWCDDSGCEREHDISGIRDTWVCQADPKNHWWRDADYRKWLWDVKRDGVWYDDAGVSAS